MESVVEGESVSAGATAAMPLADLSASEESTQIAPQSPLHEADVGAGEAAFPSPAERSSPLSAVQDIPVKVKVVLGRARMSIERLLEMKAGAVVELDRRVGEPVDVYVNDRLIARGEVVMVDAALGVTLTEVVRQEG